MDEHKHCMNTLLGRGKMIELAIPIGKRYTDKKYNKLLQWFKDTYELKRKHTPNLSKKSNEAKEQ